MLIIGHIRSVIAAVVTLSGIMVLCVSAARAQDLESRPPCETACELLRNRIEAAGFPPRLVVGDEVIYASDILPSFYEQRAYRVAWSGNGGPLPQADSLVAAIKRAGIEGLHPEDYHLMEIGTALASLPPRRVPARPVDPRLLVDLDLLLTDAFLVYGFHLLAGRLDPESIDPEWHVEPSEVDLREVLADALAGNRVAGALRDLLPESDSYYGLRKALATYREIVARGGWPLVPEGGRLEKGATGERVDVLGRRLEAEGDLDTGRPEGGAFDDALEDAVKRFQRRHGLEIDGVVGPKTLAALNITAKERLRQIEVNMERWRWLPRDLGDRYIQVNIAGFDLTVFEAGQPIMNMRAITGRDYRRTPVFSDLMTYLVINPYWEVPWNIAVKDKLPLIRQDPGYLADQGIRVFSGWGAEAVEIDPSTIDWSKVTQSGFVWRLRQDPGAKNALGRLKFMFPNKFNVYLHDTPSRELFELPVRAFSSGCIRIEYPIDLAEYLLRGNPQWTRPAILAAIDKGVEQTVRLPEPIPVYILYCTAWVDENGKVSFRNDIYGRDEAVAAALERIPPTPEEFVTTEGYEPADSER
jgi:murein L,D-transpeptidase YcbB/YkuD